MSVEAVKAAFATEVDKPSHKLVLLSLAERADRLTELCWPAVDDTERRTGLSRRAVQTALRKLEAQGHITRVTQQGMAKAVKSNTYRVHPRPASGGRLNASAAQEGCNSDTPPAQPLRPPGASAAPRERSDCAQTIREQKKEKSLTQPVGARGFVSSSRQFQNEKRNRAGPPNEAELVASCLELGITADDGRACIAEWEDSDWQIAGEPIRDWRALLRSRKDREQLPSHRSKAEDHGPPPVPRHWEPPPWDWQALYREHFDIEPPEYWSMIQDFAQAELRELHKKRKELAALPAPLEVMEAWIMDQFLYYPHRGTPWFSLPAEDRQTFILKYERWAREKAREAAKRASESSDATPSAEQ